MKIYFGTINESHEQCDACTTQSSAFCRCNNIRVLEDNIAFSNIDPRLDLANHSPTGFAWGYEGSGPAQAALAILADYLGDEFALAHYQEFKRAYINKYAQDSMFQLSGEIIDFWRSINKLT